MTEAREPTKSPQGRILLLLFFGVLMGALDIAIVGPALPAIQSAFHLDARGVAWVFTIFVLTNLVGTPIMAKLSDVYGRRGVYTLCVVLFGLGSLAVAVAPSYAVMLAGRAVQGLGSGGIFPVASAIIGDTFPPEKRGSALGLIGAVFGIAFLVGPIIGGLLLMIGWRWLFVVNLPIAAVLVVASLRLLPSTGAAEKKPIDVAGIATLGLGLTALALGISDLDAAHLVSSFLGLAVWPLLAAGVVLIFVFVLLERRAADPVLRPGLLGSRQIALAALFAAGAGLGEAGMVFLPGYAVDSLHVSHSAASFMLLPVVLAMGVGSPVVGRLLDRIGSKPVILGGLVLFTTGLWMFARFSGSAVLFDTAGALVGLGLASLLGAPLRYILLAETSAEERGAGQAVLPLFTGVGQLVSAALVGAVVASAGGGTPGYQHAFLVMEIVIAVLTLLAFGLKGRRAELAAVHAAEAGTPEAEARA